MHEAGHGPGSQLARLAQIRLNLRLGFPGGWCPRSVHLTVKHNRQLLATFSLRAANQCECAEFPERILGLVETVTAKQKSQ